jgi:hypothetical protein
VNQDRIHVPSSQGQIPYGFTIDPKGSQDFRFTLVDPMEGGGVDHHLRPLGLQDAVNPIRFNNVQGLPGRGHQLVTGQGLDQIGSQLAGSSNQEYLQITGSSQTLEILGNYNLD